MAAPTPELAQIIDDLRDKGIDVVRISYSDMIGVDRGRDVLLEELPTAMGHGLAFCRAIFHTSPQGDVVPVAGGLDAGLPDVSVRPDLSTLAPMPWEPNAAWAIGEVNGPDGAPHSESPRAVLQRVESLLAEHDVHAVIGPELEYYLLEEDATAPGGWKRYADAPGNVYVVGTKGDPKRHLITTLRLLRDAGLRVTAANHEFCGGQFEINLTHSPALDAADRVVPDEVGDPGDRAALRHAGHLHGQAVQRRGRVRLPPAHVPGRRGRSQRLR